MGVSSPVYAGNLSTNTDRGHSPNLWKDCPIASILDGAVSDGYYWKDDFGDYPLPGTQTTEIWLGKYKVYNTGAGKIITDAMPHSTTPAGRGGIISMLCDTDGDQSVIGTQACPILLDTTLTTMKVWFEARVAIDSILTNMGQWFVGLAENAVMTYAAAVPLANADAVSNTGALLGFNRLEDGLAVLNTSYADHATSWTNVKAAAYTTLAAQTWVKLGIKVDMSNPAKCVQFYVDNKELGDGITRAALAALTHVDAKGLGPCMAFFADSAGTACYTYLDWWEVAFVVA